jgi:hypothetical protein
MKNSFELQKNGKVAQTCFANAEKKLIVTANNTGYGFNFKYREMAVESQVKFHNLFGFNLKASWSKGRNITPAYSQSVMESIGFTLVKRGDIPTF